MQPGGGATTTTTTPIDEQEDDPMYKLLIAAGVTPTPAIFRLMNTHFYSRIGVALLTQNKTTARDIYTQAEGLPQTSTCDDFRRDGYLIDGSLMILYQDVDVFVCKGLTTLEARRAHAFLDAISGAPPQPNIVPFELRKQGPHGKEFMIMPKMRCSLEATMLSPPASERLWIAMKAAFDFLHSVGYAHMDVKPANVCADERGTFVLIDLGSLVQIGQRTESTALYVPLDMWRTNASSPWLSDSDVDWWMLAMTLAEKSCGASSLIIGQGGSRSTLTRSELVEHLDAHLPAALKSVVVGLLKSLASWSVDVETASAILCANCNCSVREQQRFDGSRA